MISKRCPDILSTTKTSKHRSDRSCTVTFGGLPQSALFSHQLFSKHCAVPRRQTVISETFETACLSHGAIRHCCCQSAGAPTFLSAPTIPNNSRNLQHWITRRKCSSQFLSTRVILHYFSQSLNSTADWSRIRRISLRFWNVIEGADIVPSSRIIFISSTISLLRSLFSDPK